jgi:type IV pilus assembly protein PilQ
MKKNHNCLKFVSGATVILLTTQPLAIASNNLKPKNDRSKLLAQAIQTNPNQEVLFPNPTISIDGKPVESSQPSPPPFLPRAVAPPVGDISVSNTNVEGKDIDLQTSVLLPRLVLREAPIREVLSLLSRAAGLNIIFTEAETDDKSDGSEVNSVMNTISLDLENEPVQDVFNNILKISGLEANRQGNTIFVGSRLPYGAKNIISRTLRVNQASAETLASNLALLGATVQLVVQEFEDVFSEGRLVSRTLKENKIIPLTSNTDDNQKLGTPLPLKQLNVSADTRTNSITLTGTPNQVLIASKLIVESDVRLRQVAVNVKVVDIQLNDQASFGSSFSFGIDNTGVVQDGGVGVINFGTNNQNVDPNRWRVDPLTGQLIPAFDEQISTETINTEDMTRALTESLQDNVTRSLESQLDDDVIDNLTQTFNDTINRTLSQFGNTTSFDRNQVENLTRELQRNLTDSVTRTLNEQQIDDISEDITNNVISSTTSTIRRVLQGLPLGTPNSGQISPFGTNATGNLIGQRATIRPGQNFNVPQAFLAQIRANLTSGNGKILTDPTLVVQEKQTGTVQLVENVVTSVNTQVDVDQGVGVRTITPVIEPAGLTLDVKVERIDDNGFIALEVRPTVSVPGNPQRFDSGAGAVNEIRPLRQRSVTSGLIRLRDGQTLILSGIISEAEVTQVSKVPILGDLPIIGSLFRSSSTDTTRNEVIVLLTPQIINDSDAYSGFGYNYNPSRETSEYLRDRGLTLPTNPY